MLYTVRLFCIVFTQTTWVSALRINQQTSLPFVPGQEKCDEPIPGACAPHVVITGTSKCGTNAIKSYLARYGFQGQSKPACNRMLKKVHWCGEINWNFDTAPLTNYEAKKEYMDNFDASHWPNLDHSTTYLRMAENKSFADNMKNSLPRSKMIAVVCDPVKRPWSRMMQERHDRGLDDKSKCPWYWTNPQDHVFNYTKTIVDKLDAGISPENIEECSWCRLFCTELTSGNYLVQLKNLETNYGPNFRWFISEEILADVPKFTRQLTSFLKAKSPGNLETVGMVHTSSHDRTYLPRKGKLWQQYYDLLNNRYQWQEVLNKYAKKYSTDVKFVNMKQRNDISIGVSDDIEDLLEVALA